MADTDRNLLFAVVALQDEYISSSQFVEACSAWAGRSEGRLADLLVERGWVGAEECQEIERKLDRKLARYGGDSHVTLAAVADSEARELIQQVDDSELNATLATIAPTHGLVRPEPDVKPSPNRRRYSWDHVHAEGGLGRVWIARDDDLNREVAIKEIKPRYADYPEARRRFTREAQITGQLEHPSIVPVYELARQEPGGRPFYTMRFVRGKTLRDAIADFHQRRREHRADPLARLKLLHAFVSVCQAIGYAHSRGVIHRDLKPENVILGAFGEAIVLDWGLAKLIDRDDVPPEAEEALSGIAEPAVALSGEAAAGASMMGQQLGTPAYMAPEQAEGRTTDVGTRTDVYGLGAILFEILTGRPPHVGNTSVEVLKRIAESRASPRPRETGVPVPPALDAVCARAMARDVKQRYPHVSDLAEDVQRWLADEPVSAYPEWFGRRLWRYGRNHPWVVRAIGLATAVLISVFLLSFMVVASIALIWVPLGGLIGTLVGVFQGGARQGARNGAAFGFRVGLILGVITFFALVAFELVDKLWLRH